MIVLLFQANMFSRFCLAALEKNCCETKSRIESLGTIEAKSCSPVERMRGLVGQSSPNPTDLIFSAVPIVICGRTDLEEPEELPWLPLTIFPEVGTAFLL